MKGGASRGSARVKGLKGEEVHEGRGRERGKGRAIKGRSATSWRNMHGVCFITG